MKITLHFILLLAIISGCREMPKDRQVESQSDSIEKTQEEAKDIIIEFRLLLQADRLDEAKAFVNRYGVNFRDKRDRTFFRTAVHNNLQIAEYLLENGYQLNGYDISDLYDATRNDSENCRRLLMTYVHDRSSVLELLLTRCDIELLKLIDIEEGVTLDTCITYDGHTKYVYHCACLLYRCDSLATSAYLLMKDMGMNISNNENECMLNSIVFEGIPRFVNIGFLEQLMHDGWLKETHEWSPLKSSCIWNENEIIEFLLDKGYDPNWNNSSDLLYHALNRAGDGMGEHLHKETRLRTVELLLEYGAKPELDMTMKFGDSDEKMNFNQFAKKWKFEDNSELLTMLKKYAR